MAGYEEEIKDALEMIEEAGQLVKWRTVGRVADPTKPWLNTGTPVDHDVHIAFFPNDLKNREFLRYIATTDIPTSSLYGLMGAVNFEPLLSDVVLRATVEYRIKTIDPLAPNGDVILYTIVFDR